jgi:hypothetical protein
MGIIGHHLCPSCHLFTKGQVGLITIMESNQNTLTLIDACWIVDHGFPGSKIGRKSIVFIYDIYKQKTSRTHEQKSTMNNTKE